MTSAARILTGPDVLATLGTALDALHEATDVPVTARRPWLRVWCETHGDQRPLAAAVPAPDGGLAAAALLATRRRRGRTEVVAMGHGPSDYARFPARDSEAARALALGVAGMVRAIPGAWSLRVEQLPAGDPVAMALASELRPAALLAGDDAPRTTFEEDRSAGSVLSKNTRQSERTRWNRIRREALPVAMELVTGPDRLTELLPGMERVRRDREVALAMRSPFDDPRALAFWRSVLVELTARGEAETNVLWLAGELAAYTVCIRDGQAYRMWDTRFDPSWGRFAVGRLSVLATMRRALLLPPVSVYDFMRGTEEYKQRLMTETVPASTLVAWSSAATRIVAESPRATRRGLRRLRERSALVDRAWMGVKRRLIRAPKGR